MERGNKKSPILLTVAAAIWGFAFVAQSQGMEYVGPFTFNCIRNLLGALVLLPVILVRDKAAAISAKEGEPAWGERDGRRLLTGGLCCGLILWLSSGMQQIGIQYTTVGKAGFITAIYIVLVPVYGIFLKRRCGLRVWLGVGLASAGFYFLTMIGESAFTKGDLYVFICAVCFAAHILCVDYFSPRTDCVKLSCIQFLVCGLVSGVVMLLFENPVPAAIVQAWKPLLYTGVLSSGVAYTLQIVGQKNFNPTIAALLMSLESVFSVLAGWIVLHQALKASEIAGCILIFAAIILAQLPEKQNCGI